MRLLMVTDNFCPLYGGSQTVALELGAALASRGHAVTALARNRNQVLPAHETIRGVFVNRYPVTSRFVPKSFLKRCICRQRANYSTYARLT